MSRRALVIVVAGIVTALATAETALAQSGTIEGRIVDQQSSAVPGVVDLNIPMKQFGVYLQDDFVNGEIVSPRLEQPFSRQTSIGRSHQIDSVTSFSADYVHADGRDLSIRLRLNDVPWRLPNTIERERPVRSVVPHRIAISV